MKETPGIKQATKLFFQGNEWFTEGLLNSYVEVIEKRSISSCRTQTISAPAERMWQIYRLSGSMYTEENRLQLLSLTDLSKHLYTNKSQLQDIQV